MEWFLSIAPILFAVLVGCSVVAAILVWLARPGAGKRAGHQTKLQLSEASTLLAVAPLSSNILDRRARAKHIADICDEFTEAMRAGDQPKIETFLDRCPADEQDWLLKELLLLEIEFQFEAHVDVESAEYVARFPQAEQVVRDVFREASTVAGNLTLSSLPRLLTSCKSGAGQSVSVPLAELQRLANERSFAPGEPLVRQGEAATSLMVICAGAVEIRVEDDAGTTHVIGCLGPGQVLGEMALLTNEPRTASAVATEQVRAAVLPVAAFHQLSSRYPQFSTLLTELIAERLGNAPQDALTNKLLDRYRIRRRLGRGGMSVVYEALDTTNDSRVALKMMSHRLVSSPVALRRFQREADMIEQLNHPYIVSMYSRFAAFRTYFIAMEYCEGETLAQYIDTHGALTESSFRRALSQLALALLHAHDAGIVHRDLKPSNIMRLPDGTLKLMDFGLAEPIATEAIAAGEVVGTPRYMAPEQRGGGAVDERSDYFSLGCVAYEMLTGTPLFSRSMLHELIRDFRKWQLPDLAVAGTPLTEDETRLLRPLFAVDPNERNVDLQGIAAWSD